MGRRSDHTREQLEALLIAEGRRQLAETGLAKFSAREVAKQVGYSIGTLYNVFGSYDGLMVAINGRTLVLWADHLRTRLAAAGEDRIAVLVRAYFEFALKNPKIWLAVYEHHMADGSAAPEWYEALAADLMTIVASEIAAVLPRDVRQAALPLARSLLATVHGHCVFHLYGTFNLLGEAAPVEAALARVREAITAAGGKAGPAPP